MGTLARRPASCRRLGHDLAVDQRLDRRSREIRLVEATRQPQSAGPGDVSHCRRGGRRPRLGQPHRMSEPVAGVRKSRLERRCSVQHDVRQTQAEAGPGRACLGEVRHETIRSHQADRKPVGHDLDDQRRRRVGRVEGVARRTSVVRHREGADEARPVHLGAAQGSDTSSAPPAGIAAKAATTASGGVVQSKTQSRSAASNSPPDQSK